MLQAARALEQINNQITSLQNEAQMLINQARNLASLPYSSLQRLQQSVQRTQQLLGQAQNIAFDVQQVDRAFQTTYGNASLSASDQQLIADARIRWQNTVGGLQDAMRVQAGVVGNIDTNRTEMSALVGQSQGATGALQATQAGNQLLALQAQQLADLTAVVAADGRARALADAERARRPSKAANSAGASSRRAPAISPATRACSRAAATEGAAVDGKILARIGAVAFVAVAMTATIIELSRKEERPDVTPGAARRRRARRTRCKPSCSDARASARPGRATRHAPPHLGREPPAFPVAPRVTPSPSSSGSNWPTGGARRKRRTGRRVASWAAPASSTISSRSSPATSTAASACLAAKSRSSRPR